MLVELTQPHKLEAAKKTQSRPYYPKEDVGRRARRTAQAIAKLVRPFAAETLGEAKTFCKGAPVLAWDAQGSRWLHAKITEVLEQKQAGTNAQGMDANAFFATDADRYVCVTNASKRVLRVTKNRCYHLSDSGIGMVMREAAAKGCFVLIDAIVAAGVCLFDSDENAHTPVLCAAEAGQAEMVAHLISKEIEQVAGHKGDPFARTSNTTSYQMAIRNRHALLAHDRPGAQDLEVTPLIKKLVNGEITGYDLHLAALRGEVHHVQEHLDSAKAKAEHNAAVATGSCAPINKLIPVEANDGKDALRAFLHKVPKEGEADTPERVKKLLRKACKEGDPEANNPAQGVSAMLAARGNAVVPCGCCSSTRRTSACAPKGVTALSIAAEEGYEELAHPPQRGRRPEHRRRGRRWLAGRVVAADGVLVQRPPRDVPHDDRAGRRHQLRRREWVDRADLGGVQRPR